MNINLIENKNLKIAVETTKDQLIFDDQSALDYLMTINYEYGCNCIVLNKENFVEEFFDLSTKIAGDVVQKIVNYNMKVAIIGDFSNYKSKSLNDFIYECNKGKYLFFVETQSEAIEKLGD